MLLGFKPRFIRTINNGTKIFTLRNEPKRMPKIGETLHMYTGLRSKNCSLITKAHTLKSIQEVELKIIVDPKFIPGYERNLKPEEDYPFDVWITIDGRRINNASEIQKHFYLSDGFMDEIDFVRYWTDGFKIKAIKQELIQLHWTDFKY